MSMLLFAAGLAIQPPQVDGQAVCRAAPAAVVVGEPYRRQMPSHVKRLAGARIVQVLLPGEIATADFRADRVRIQLDDRRRVTAITCG